MEQVAATQQVFHGPLARLVDSEAYWAQMSNQQTVWREKMDNDLELDMCQEVVQGAVVRGAHGRCKHRTQEVTQSSFLGQTFHSIVWLVTSCKLQVITPLAVVMGPMLQCYNCHHLPATATRRLNPLDAGSDCYTLPLLVGTKNM